MTITVYIPPKTLQNNRNVRAYSKRFDETDDGSFLALSEWLANSVYSRIVRSLIDGSGKFYFGVSFLKCLTSSKIELTSISVGDRCRFTTDETCNDKIEFSKENSSAAMVDTLASILVGDADSDNNCGLVEGSYARIDVGFVGVETGIRSKSLFLQNKKDEDVGVRAYKAALKDEGDDLLSILRATNPLILFLATPHRGGLMEPALGSYLPAQRIIDESNLSLNAMILERLKEGPKKSHNAVLRHIASVLCQARRGAEELQKITANGLDNLLSLVNSDQRSIIETLIATGAIREDVQEAHSGEKALTVAPIVEKSLETLVRSWNERSEKMLELTELSKLSELRLSLMLLQVLLVTDMGELFLRDVFSLEEMFLQATKRLNFSRDFSNTHIAFFMGFIAGHISAMKRQSHMRGKIVVADVANIVRSVCFFSKNKIHDLRGALQDDMRRDTMPPSPWEIIRMPPVQPMRMTQFTILVSEHSIGGHVNDSPQSPREKGLKIYGGLSKGLQTACKCIRKGSFPGLLKKAVAEGDFVALRDAELDAKLREELRKMAAKDRQINNVSPVSVAGLVLK